MKITNKVLLGIATIFGIAVFTNAISSSSTSTNTPTVVSVTPEVVQTTEVVITTPSITPLPFTLSPTPMAVCGYGYYINVDGNCIKDPVQSNMIPQGASAQCRDESYSFSQHRQGTCSHHGGVAEWL